MKANKELAQDNITMLDRHQEEKVALEAIMPQWESESEEMEEELKEDYKEVGEFIHMYAIVLTTRKYSNLRKIYPNISDLKWVKKDRINNMA